MCRFCWLVKTRKTENWDCLNVNLFSVLFGKFYCIVLNTVDDCVCVCVGCMCVCVNIFSFLLFLDYFTLHHSLDTRCGMSVCLLSNFILSFQFSVLVLCGFFFILLHLLLFCLCFLFYFIPPSVFDHILYSFCYMPLICIMCTAVI